MMNLERRVSIAVQTIRKNSPNVAIRVNNIGMVLKAKGDFDGALEKFREAERIDRAAFGDDHPNVAIRVNNIGSVLLARGGPPSIEHMTSLNAWASPCA